MIRNIYIEQDVDIETNIEKIAHLGKTVSLCNYVISSSQANFESIKKLSKTEAVLKKIVAYKKKPVVGF